MTVGVCPYCGAKLNLGLKFCVLCGRHIADATEKLGGLKSGFRPADITWRLAEIVTVGKFKRSRRNTSFERAVRGIFRYCFTFVSSFILCFMLLYSVVQLSLELADPKRAAETRIPIKKVAGFVADKVGDHVPDGWDDKIRQAGDHADKHLQNVMSTAKQVTATPDAPAEAQTTKQAKPTKKSTSRSKRKRRSRSSTRNNRNH